MVMMMIAALLLLMRRMICSRRTRKCNCVPYSCIKLGEIEVGVLQNITRQKEHNAEIKTRGYSATFYREGNAQDEDDHDHYDDNEDGGKKKREEQKQKVQHFSPWFILLSLT